MSTELPISSSVSLMNSGKECLTSFSFHIPAYQRPYSWGEDQIDDFLKTITDGFVDNAPKFFGTMQFVVKNSGVDVVDGQQRLTTMKLFAYVLSGLAKRECFNIDIDYNNMKNANQIINDLLLKDVASVQATEKNKRGKVDTKDLYSVFEASVRMLKEKLLKYCEEDSKKRCLEQYASDLIDYFADRIYVVVLKTDEVLPLPEVVSIFNTINRTGMDLNTEDIFKFQYYEYLRKNEVSPESRENDEYWIERINSCYKKIEEFNEGKPIKKHITMTDVLSIYQHCICAKYEDDYKTLAKSSNRFFTDVFKEYNDYKDLLEFSQFERLVNEYIDFYTELEKNQYSENSLHALSIELIKLTRYPRYWTFPYVYSFFVGDDHKTRSDALTIGYYLFSYLIVHSINYAKAVNPVHTFVCKEILPAIIQEKDIKQLLEDMQWSDPYEESVNSKAKQYFRSALDKNAIRSSKTGVICLLLALNYEKNADLQVLKDKFFNWEIHPYDIEHIYSYDSFTDEETGKQFSEDDKACFNGLGNLIILEQKINRDMGRKQVLLPSQKYEKRAEYYEKSDYKIVRDFVPYLNDWSIKQVKERSNNLQNVLVDEILNISKN